MECSKSKEVGKGVEVGEEEGCGKVDVCEENEGF